LGVGKSWGKWNAQVNWQAQGNATDTGKTKVGGYGVINTALSYSLQDNLKIGLSVGNIFNRHYQTVYGYNSMPRNFLLSLQYQPKW
jgi:vitamin B12 transporter